MSEMRAKREAIDAHAMGAVSFNFSGGAPSPPGASVGHVDGFSPMAPQVRPTYHRP